MDPSGLIGPVSTRTHRIDNFDSFILHNVPYAEVPPKDIRWGNVQYDGPTAPGIDFGKPALQWHFGGVPYPISKAIRIPYSYVRRWDGSNDIIPASIFLGFQDGLDQVIKARPIPYVIPTATFNQRVSDFGPFGAFSNQFWASDAAVLASEAIGLVTRSIWHDPAAWSTFDNFIEAELNLNQARFDALLAFPTPVDFEGLAQDNDSQNVFQYMAATVVNDPAVYRRLVQWYFGGKAYSLTKVMRISLDTDYSAGAQPQSFVQNAVPQVQAQIQAQPMPKAPGGAAPQPPQPTATTQPQAPHTIAPQSAQERFVRRQAALIRQGKIKGPVAADDAAKQKALHDAGLVAADPQGFALFVGYGGGVGGDG